MFSWTRSFGDFARGGCLHNGKLFTGSVVLGFVLFLLLFLIPSSNAQRSFPPHVEGQLIIKFVDGTTENQKKEIRNNLNSVTLRKFSLIGAELVRISGMSVEQAIDLFKEDPRVMYVEPNYIWRADIIPNDPDFDLLWGMYNTGQTGGKVDADIDAVEAWNISTGDSIIVGVIDTGLDTAHVDLEGNIWTNPGEIPDNGMDDDGNGYVDDIHGWDFINWDNDPVDDNGHGTHCSGTISAVGNNAIGVAGVCWSAKIMALKFLNSSGEGTTEDAVLAVEYANRMGARLTSNSWGGGGYSQALKDAIDSSGAQGMLFVVAAGNYRNNNDVSPYFPSSYDLENIIAVAATDHYDNLANEPTWGSNYGLTSVDLGAPGVNIYSTIPGDGYGYKSGTSMATPHVSGTAALLWSEHPSLTYLQVKNRILSMTDTLPDLAGKCVSGGRLNAFMTIAEPDSTCPYPISDLIVTKTEGTRITLSWTSTGDDSSLGRASYYDLRYSFSPIDSSNFNSAFETFGEPDPQVSGFTETFVVTGLDFNTTYYFAVKAYDEWNNPSEVSNSPWGTTLSPPEIAVTPDSLYDSLYVNGNSIQKLNIANLKEGELFYEIDVEYPTTREASGGIVIPPPVSEVFGEASFAQQKRNYFNEIEFDITGEKLTLGTRDVLLVYADVGASALRSILVSYPDIGLVDLWYSGSLGGTIPSLSDLEVYDCVLAWNNQAWANMYAIGDVLADYIDQGGAVVTMVDCWSAGTYASRGRYFEEKDYSPFKSLGEAIFESRILGWYDTSHPMMDGVGSLATSSYYNNTTLTDGAVEAARWDDGTPLVAFNPHTVAINLWPGDGYYWTGDFPTLVHNAVNYLTSGTFWLSVKPDSGEVAPYSEKELDVNFNAQNSEGGDYQSTISIRSNDPDDSLVSVSVWLHVIDSPDIELDSDSFDFGITYIGFPESLSLLVSNDGTHILTVTEVFTENSEFSVDVTNFVLSPDEDTVVNVTFSPSFAGELWSHLIIDSDDPDESTLTVTLRGEGLLCPDIWVDPDSVLDSLFVEETLVETLTIGNSGGSPLYLEVDLINYVESLPWSGGDLETGVWSAQKGYSIQEILYFRGKRIPDYDPDARSTSGLYEAGQDGFSNISAAPGNVLASWHVPSPIQHAWGLGFDGMDVWVSDLEEVTDSEADTLGAMLSWFNCSDWADAWPADMTWDGQYIWQVNVGGDNGMYQLDPKSGAVLNSIHDPDHTWDAISQRGLAYDKRKDVFYIGGWNQDRIYKIKGLSWDNPGEILNSFYFPSVSGLAWNPQGFLWVTVNAGADYIYQVNPETEEVISQFLAPGNDSGYEGAGLALDRWGNLWYVSQITQKVYLVESGVPAYPWLEVNPWACTLQVGETKEFEARFDADGLLGGEYSADIIFQSNDCDQPSLTVPAFFHVIGFPDMVLSEDTLDYNTIFVGFSLTDTLVIFNQGNDLLTINNIYSDDSDYTVDITNFSLGPKDSQEVIVTFAPTRDGEILGNLTIESNDSTEPIVTVPLLGQGLYVPEISVYPDSLSQDLLTGDTLTQVLTISNDGLSDLNFTISITPSSTELDFGKIVGEHHKLNPLPVAKPKTPQDDFDQIEETGSFLSLFTGGFDKNNGFVGDWESRSPLSKPRAQHGLVAHPNGKIYAFGGYAGGSTKFLSMEIYDPQTDSWTPGAYMPEADQGMAVAIDNYGYIYSFTATQSGSFRYDPVSDEWTTINSPPVTWVEEAGAAKGLDGRIYLFGGAGPVDVVQIYDPETESWVMGSPMPTPRYQLGVVTGSDGLIYAIGGRSSPLGDPVDIVEVYDPFRDTWSSASPMPTARNQFAISLGADNRIYTIGGKTASEPNQSPFYYIVEIYDPVTDTWETGLPAPTARGEMDAVLCGNGIYVIGGTVGSYLATNEVLYTYGWLSADPVWGTLPPGSSMDIEITYDAAGMNGGDHSAEVVISSNDPYDPEVIIPAHLNVTNAPDITISQNTLDYGSVHLGTSVIDTLIVLNGGSSLMTVSDMASDNSDYTIDNTSFDLELGESHKVVITFAPTTTGTINGQLTITSDDPDEAAVLVGLQGKGSEPPDISKYPDSLTDSLFTDSTSTQVITISNQGLGDLTFSICIEESLISQWAKVGSTSLAKSKKQSIEEVKGIKVSSLKKPHSDFSELSDKTPLDITTYKGNTNPSSQGVLYVVDARSDQIKELNQITWEVVRSFPVPENADGAEGLAFDGTYLYYVHGRYWTTTIFQLDRFTGQVVDSLNIPDKEWFDALAHSGDHLYGMRWGDNTIYKFDFEADSIVDQHTFEFSLEGGMTFAGNRGTIFVSDFYKWIYEIDPSNWRVLKRFGSEEFGGIFGLGYSKALNLLFVNSVYYHDLIYVVNPDNGEVLSAYPSDGITGLAADEWAGVSWLSYNPASDTISSDSSLDIEIVFDATNLYGGDYLADIVIYSNDPDQLDAGIPACLHVTGIPQIAISDDTLNLGEVFIGGSKTDTVIIYNQGTDLLTINDISSDNSDYTVDTTSFSLNPDEDFNVLVSFSPNATGQINATLTIESDDPYNPMVIVALQGQGSLPPDIAVSPDSLSEELLRGDTLTQVVTVSNEGENNLDFKITIKEKHYPASLEQARFKTFLEEYHGESVYRASQQNPVYSDKYSRGVLQYTEPEDKPLLKGSIEGVVEYSGDYLNFGISDYGEIIPFEYPIGRQQLWGSGYTVIYMVNDTDYVKWARPEYRVGIVPVSYAELVNDSSRLRVEVITRTDDGRLEIKRVITFDRMDKYINIQTSLENISGMQLNDLAFKSFADWDVDQDCCDDNWDYDRIRNMVYAWDSVYVASASGQMPDFMDLYGWNDYRYRTTTIDFPVGPIHNFDGCGILHFELGNISMDSSANITTTFGAGDSLLELQEVIDRGLQFGYWLSTNPTFGSIASHSNMPVLITFNSSDLSESNYYADIVILSNDPDESEIALPVHLRVIQRGDVNGDLRVTISDVVYLINYLYKFGPPPYILQAGDVNCDNEIDIIDAVYIVNYLFKSGPPPC
ncbi:MAG: glutaminyl-peptide cyclotransferase [Candidatus Zixiibacteriota bacterium]